MDGLKTQTQLYRPLDCKSPPAHGIAAWVLRRSLDGAHERQDGAYDGKDGVDSEGTEWWHRDVDQSQVPDSQNDSKRCAACVACSGVAIVHRGVVEFPGPLGRCKRERRRHKFTQRR